MHYNQEGLREELRQALLVVPRTRGQLDGFENNGYSSKYGRSPTHEIEIGGGSIKVKAEVVRTLACKTFKQSPMPLPPQAFKFTKLVRVMNSARPCVAEWLRYCYSDGAQLPSREFLVELLTQFAEQEERALRGSSAELIKHLALLACQQKRDQINAGKDMLTQTKIAQLAGKSTAAWNKRWSCRWNRLLRIIELFDQEGLDHVYECGRRDKATRRNGNVPLQRRLRSAARNEMVTRVAI
ncbi:bacteriophage antitermination protein Q [Vibrio parahaemolyticus]|uniref:bacteriophage antitermination protein Q n=1 Tax=Vibrio parahaemolyticus TaxID=670 RepID=UPI002F2BF8EC